MAVMPSCCGSNQRQESLDTEEVDMKILTGTGGGEGDK